MSNEDVYFWRAIAIAAVLYVVTHAFAFWLGTVVA